MNINSLPEFNDCLAHYTKLEHLANILADGNIRFSKVGNFSDPRESSIGWLESCGWPTQPNKIRSELREYLKILCCISPQVSCVPGLSSIESEIYCRPRMWAQYGDNGRGFCIIMSKTKLEKAIKQQLSSDNYFVSDKVEYPTYLGAVNGGITLEEPDLKINIEEIIKRQDTRLAIQSIFFNKSFDWKDESEHRFLVVHQSKDDFFVNISGVIEGVILGHSFPINQFAQARLYCEELGIPLYKLEHEHPSYHVNKIGK